MGRILIMTIPQFKPLIPGDWEHLEWIIREIWRLVNSESPISDLIAQIAQNASDIDALEALVAALDAVAGNDGEIQFNDGGNHGADSDLTFDTATKTFKTNTAQVTRLLAGGVYE